MLGPVEIVDEVDSTNAELLRRAAAGAPHGLVLVADHQTAGRGRLGRQWEAAPGQALLVSVLLRPAIDAARAHLLTCAAGLAAVEAAGVGELKWPNDVVAGSRKLAGILAESVLNGTEVAAVVVGMGMNLRPPSPAGGVSLEELVGPADRDQVLGRWLSGFERRLAAIDAVMSEYRARCATIGQEVRVELPDGALEGRAEGVTDDGHLVVDGREITVGDVVHLRPVE